MTLQNYIMDVLSLIPKLKKLVPKKKQTIPEKPKFSFFAFPPEIRNRIYEYAMANERTDFWFLIKPSHDCMPSILHVNERLRKEAIGYYFSALHFDFVVALDKIEPLTDFIRCLPDDARIRLRNNTDVSVRIVVPYDTVNYTVYRKYGMLGALVGSYDAAPWATGKWLFAAERASCNSLEQMVPLDNFDSQLVGRHRWADPRSSGVVRHVFSKYPSSSSANPQRVFTARRLFAETAEVARQVFTALN